MFSGRARLHLVCIAGNRRQRGGRGVGGGDGEHSCVPAKAKAALRKRGAELDSKDAAVGRRVRHLQEPEAAPAGTDSTKRPPLPAMPIVGLAAQLELTVVLKISSSPPKPLAISASVHMSCHRATGPVTVRSGGAQRVDWPPPTRHRDQRARRRRVRRCRRPRRWRRRRDHRHRRRRR